jgi:hypothetical protein
MTEMQYANKLGTVRSFLARMGILSLSEPSNIRLLETPSDEIVDSILRKGKLPRLHSMNGGQQSPIRVEENYLYYTRRFPNNTANNTIGAGAVAAGDYNYFTSGIGDGGAAAGYFSLANLTAQQTNMAAGGKIPTGRGFRLFDLGVAFNAQALGADIAQCLDTMALAYQKQAGQLRIQHGPLKFWPGGGGVSGYASAATTVAATTINVQQAANGLPACTNVRRFKAPRILSSNEDFQYLIQAAAATPNSNTTVALSNFVEVTVFMFGEVLDRIPQ